MWCAKTLFSYTVFDEINSGLVVCTCLNFNKKVTLELGGGKGVLSDLVSWAALVLQS